MSEVAHLLMHMLDGSMKSSTCQELQGLAYYCMVLIGIANSFCKPYLYLGQSIAKKDFGKLAEKAANLEYSKPPHYRKNIWRLFMCII